jgi:hypothetical protein
VKSYVDNEKTEATLMKKLLLTEMTLNPNDFETYDFNSNKRVQLTFCLKEMKVCIWREISELWKGKFRSF